MKQAAGRFARDQPRQRRPRRPDAADVMRRIGPAQGACSRWKSRLGGYHEEILFVAAPSFAVVTWPSSPRRTRAQQPPTVRIRGTIEGVDGPHAVRSRSREGATSRSASLTTSRVFGVGEDRTVRRSRKASYIGVTAHARSRTVLRRRSRCISSRRTNAARPKVFGPGMRAELAP